MSVPSLLSLGEGGMLREVSVRAALLTPRTVRGPLVILSQVLIDEQQMTEVEEMGWGSGT